MNVEEALKEYKIDNFVNTKYGIGKIIDYEIINNTDEKQIYWVVFISKNKSHIICNINDFIESNLETLKENVMSYTNEISDREILEKKIKNYLKYNLTVKLERQLPHKYSGASRKYLVAKLYLENELISISNKIEFNGDDLV